MITVNGKERNTRNFISEGKSDTELLFELFSSYIGFGDFFDNRINMYTHKGDLTMLKFIHKNAPEKFTDFGSSKLLELAANTGQFEVVKWLYLNNIQKCSAKTIELACKSGNLELVKWLNEHTTEKFPDF